MASTFADLIARAFGEAVAEDDGPLPDVVIRLSLKGPNAPMQIANSDHLGFGFVWLVEGQPYWMIFDGKGSGPGVDADGWRRTPLDRATYRAIAALFGEAA